MLPDYLVSRAQAALDTVSALEKGHAQYLASLAGECLQQVGQAGRRLADSGLLQPGCLPPGGGLFRTAGAPSGSRADGPAHSHLGTWPCGQAAFTRGCGYQVSSEGGGRDLGSLTCLVTALLPDLERDLEPALLSSSMNLGHWGRIMSLPSGSPASVSCCFPPSDLSPVTYTDASSLVAALTRFSHLAADTIINGGATSHLAPTDPADRKWALAAGSGCPTSFIRALGWRLGSRPCPPTGLVDACRECGARALELLGQLQDRQALPRAQPGLVRTPLQGILQLGQVRRTAHPELLHVPSGWG